MAEGLSIIMDLLNGFRKSKALFTAVELGVFDIITAFGTCSLQQVADELQQLGTPANLDALQRLLNTCVTLRLLEYSRSDADTESGTYSITAATKAYLTKDSPESLLGYVMHSDKVVYRLFGGLQESISTGTNCWQSQFGFQGHEMFKHIYSTHESMLRFMHGMHGFATLSARKVLTAFDLSSFPHVVDLGGSTGALMSAACTLYPQLQATVVDLPLVIETAQRHFLSPPHLTDASIMPRLHWIAADFFEQPDKVPAADLYVLSRVLHDWSERKCIRLLKLVHSKLQPGGALLVCEMLLDEGGCGPAPALLQSLNMLVQTEGKERSLQGYRTLLGAAGFARAEGKKTGAYLDAILAYK